MRKYRNRRQQRELARLVLLIIVTLGISVMILGASMRLLPDAPLFPTPTPPRAIEFPDSRPVPAR